MKKLCAALVLLVLAGIASAGYIDNRSAPGSGEIDAFYKAMPVEDVVLGIVPPSYRVSYETEEVAKRAVTVSGKGPWDVVLAKGLKESQIQVSVDESERTVRISRIEVPKKAATERTGERALSGGGGAGSALAPSTGDVSTLQACVLTTGNLVGDELQKCGQRTGWKLVWNLKRDFTVPQTTTYPGDFPTAAGDVVKTLASNGALIRASIYEGNKTVVVTGPGVASQ